MQWLRPASHGRTPICLPHPLLPYWMCQPQERCGLGLLTSLKALEWSKAHHHSPPPRLGNRQGGAAARLGVPSASLAPPGFFLAPGSRAAGANLLSRVLPGDFQFLLPDPMHSPLGNVGRLSQNPFPAGSPAQPLPALHPQTHAELSPLHPREAGSVGGRQMEGRSGGEGVLKEESNNQKH